MDHYLKKNLKFVSLTEEFHSLIEEAFKKCIESFYGNQSIAFQKIINGIGRNCEILFLNDLPIGFIVYKTTLQSEFELKNAFELKTAFLLEEYRNKGLGKALFKYAETLAIQRYATYIYTTVSEKLINVVNCMKKDGWVILKEKKSDDNSVDVFVMAKELKNES